MKKVWSSVILGLIIVSCGSTEDVVEDVNLNEGDTNAQVDESFDVGPPERVLKGNTTSFLFSYDRQDTGYVSIDYVLYSPQFSSNIMDSSFKDSVNNIVLNHAGWIGFSDLETPEIILPYHFQEIADSFAIQGQAEIDIMESTAWEAEMVSILDESYENYVELNISGWGYTGGAHGYGYDNYYQIDRKTGRTLIVDDFISDLEVLNRLGEKYLRKMYEIPVDQTLEEYGFWFNENNFQVNENFYFTPTKMVFYFNSYEIAPYAGGPTELEIPLNELDEILIK